VSETAADLLLDRLMDWGVDTIFGLHAPSWPPALNRVARRTPTQKPPSAHAERAARVPAAVISAMPSSTVLPVMSAVNTAPITRYVTASGRPAANASANSRENASFLEESPPWTRRERAERRCRQH